MKNWKASDIDRIPIELWKFGGKAIYIRWVQPFNEILAQVNIPLDWNKSTVIGYQHIRNEKNNCSN